MEGRDNDTFLESLMDTSLYSMGAYFSDQHPELVDEVIAQSESIEQDGIRPSRTRTASRWSSASRR